MDDPLDASLAGGGEQAPRVLHGSLDRSPCRALTAMARCGRVQPGRADPCKTYPGPSPIEALKPCWLRIDLGDHVAVTGPSGSGKSTFLNILGLLDSPTAGRYLLRGRNVGALREGERNRIRGRSVGFVFQFFHLLPHYSAVENVELGLLYGSGHSKRTRRVLAEEQLARVGLAHRLHADMESLRFRSCL